MTIRSPAGRIAAAAVLAGTVVHGGGCRSDGDAPASLEAALGRFRQAFEEADARRLDGLYPSGWLLVSFSGETRRSATGADLRRALTRLFRNRAPIAYEERPRSIRRSADGGYVLFVPEWTSLEIGTDRRVVELFRIGLEQVPAGGARAGGAPGWRIREFTVWTR